MRPGRNLDAGPAARKKLRFQANSTGIDPE